MHIRQIGGAVAGLSVALTGDPNPANYFIPIDPPGEKEAVRWDADAGLYLTVENACDDSWASYFDASILEWNKTEALILKTQRVPYDEKCSPRRGRLKVCNGNYGLTGNVAKRAMKHSLFLLAYNLTPATNLSLSFATGSRL